MSDGEAAMNSLIFDIRESVLTLKKNSDYWECSRRFNLAPWLARKERLQEIITICHKSNPTRNFAQATLKRLDTVISQMEWCNVLHKSYRRLGGN